MSGYLEVQRQRELHRRNLERIEEELSIYAVGQQPIHLLNQRDQELKLIEELDERLTTWPRDDVNRPLPMDRDFSDLEERYRQQVIRTYRFLTLQGYPERDPDLSAVPLQRIFIPLSTTATRALVPDWLEVALRKARLDSVARAEKDSAFVEDRELAAERTEELPLPYERRAEERRKPHAVTLAVPEALREHDRLVITGSPGSGKTTLLRWLALTFAEGKQAQTERLGDVYPHKRLPVLVELRRFHGRFAGERERLATVNLAEEIAAFVAEDARFEGTPAELIRQALANGGCMIGFDGLDEIPEFEVRQRAAAALQAFAENYAARGNRVIVTSRREGYKGVELGPGFQHCEINPFTLEDVYKFMHNWCMAAYPLDLVMAQQEADDLLEAIRGNERVAKLAQTPLLCTIIAIVYRNGRSLPNRQVELYHKCCEVLLDTWERDKEIRHSGLIGGLDWQTKLELLSPLAYWLHLEEGRTAALEAEFEHRLAAELQDRRFCGAPKAEQEARAFLTVIRERSGLLRGRDDGTLEFPHVTLQQYLAARHIAAQPYPDYINVCMPHLHQAWWQQVHLLTIGHLGSGRDGAHRASMLLQAILDRYEPVPRFLQSIPYPGSPLTQWGYFGPLGRVVEWFKTLPARMLPRWKLSRRIAWALQRERFFAATALSNCAPLGVTNRIRDQVRAALEDTLFLAIANARWGQAAGSTDDAYSVARDAPLVVAATSSVGKLEQASPETVAALVTALNDSLIDVREAAATSLGQLGQASPNVIAGLIAAFEDSDVNVRGAAATSLSRLAQISPDVVAVLITAVRNDKSWRVRRTAARCLGQLDRIGPEGTAALVAAPDDEHTDVREAAATSLSRLAQISPDVVAVLITAVRNDKSWRVRRTAARCLGQLDRIGPEGTAALVAALDDERIDVREAAASSLGELGQKSSKVIAALVSAVGDSGSWHVREAAASSLGQLGCESLEVIAALITALNDSHIDVREAAASSLGQLGQANPDVVDALVNILGDSHNDVRQAAASSLGQLGQASPKVIAALVAALVAALGDSESWYVREAAASSLGHLRRAGAEVIAALVTSLDDNWPWVRHAAASSLGQLGQASPEVIAALVAALGDSESWHVREAAVSSLGQLGQASPSVVAGLITALEDSDVSVRETAAASLGRLGQMSPEVVAALVAALGNSRSWRVRWAVALCLGELGRASMEVTAALITALNDSHIDVREAAASSLGQLGQANPDVVDALVNALGDSHNDVRQAAASSLGQLGQVSPKVIAGLIGALEDSDVSVREAVTSSLSRLEQTSPSVTTALVAALHRSENWIVRETVAQGLGGLVQASPEIISALIHALDDGESWVRKAAARSLGQSGHVVAKVLVALNRTLHDSDVSVRTAAHEALSKLLEGQAIPGDEWVPLGMQQERRERWKRRLLLAASMVLPPLAYIFAVLRLPGLKANLWMMAAFAAWIACLGALADYLGWWRGPRRRV